jgi:hypothetical protein
LKARSIESYVLLSQGIGLIFFVIFVAAYFGGMPSSGNLIGDSTFRTTLSIFGGIFLILIVGELFIATLMKQKKLKTQ